MIQLIFSTTLLIFFTARRSETRHNYSMIMSVRLSVCLYHGGGAYSSANFTDGNILLTERTSKIKFT